MHIQVVRSIIIVKANDFEFIPIDDFHTAFHLWEDTHKDFMLTDALEIHFVDMIKFKRLKDKDIKNNSLHRWLTFFDKDTPEDVLKEVLVMEEAIKKANEKISYVASDAASVRMYEMREMALSDYTTGINHAKREESKKWQSIVAEKDSALAEKDSALAEKDSALAEKDAQIAELLDRLGGRK